jgi:hypothetical protein
MDIINIKNLELQFDIETGDLSEQDVASIVEAQLAVINEMLQDSLPWSSPVLKTKNATFERVTFSDDLRITEES